MYLWVHGAARRSPIHFATGTCCSSSNDSKHDGRLHKNYSSGERPPVRQPALKGEPEGPDRHLFVGGAWWQKCECGPLEAILRCGGMPPRHSPGVVRK
jgi:hypothetical protein